MKRLVGRYGAGRGGPADERQRLVVEHGLDGKPRGRRIEAKWLGDCKPGQKPGDIVMPGGGFKLNVKDADKLKALLPPKAN